MLKIKNLLLKYINIIIKEHPKSNGKTANDKINNGKDVVEFNRTNTISFFVQNGTLLLPQTAYSIFPLLKKYENYGKKVNNDRNIEDYLDTNITYIEYINHIIEGSLSVYDYFEESLLHETMHICDSQSAHH